MQFNAHSKQKLRDFFKRQMQKKKRITKWQFILESDSNSSDRISGYYQRNVLIPNLDNSSLQKIGFESYSAFKYFRIAWFFGWRLDKYSFFIFRGITVREPSVREAITKIYNWTVFEHSLCYIKYLCNISYVLLQSKFPRNDFSLKEANFRK